MPFDDVNLRTFCSMGVPVTFAGISAYPDGVPIKGNFDRTSQLMLGESGFGGVDVARPQVSLPFNAFPIMPDADDTLLVNGVAYRTDAPVAEDDGAFLIYELSLTSIAAPPPSNATVQSAPAATFSSAYVAASTLSALEAVYDAGGGLAGVADSSDLRQIGHVIGITPAGAQQGSPVQIQVQGQLSNQGWSWLPVLPIYLGLAGALTQTPPDSGFQQRMAIPLSTTTILVDFDDPIQL